MSLERVRSYLANGFEDVPGWCSGRFLEIMACLGDEMAAVGVVGGACEIGVYQGKFIIGLSHVVDGRPSLSIDIFDNQEENVDNSGGGRSDMFTGYRDNVSKYGYSTTKDMTINSFALNTREQISILDRFGPFQIFSIDGGHTAVHVVHDYRIAEEVTHHGGAIIIDDVCNAGWPGVMEGIAHIFTHFRPKFIPLMIGHNKLVLVGMTYHKRYFTSIVVRVKDAIPGQELWPTKFYGYDILTIP